MNEVLLVVCLCMAFISLLLSRLLLTCGVGPASVCHSPGAPLTISAWRATGSCVSVTEVEVEYWSLVKAGLAVAARGTLRTCLAMMAADMVRMFKGELEEEKEKRETEC